MLLLETPLGLLSSPLALGFFDAVGVGMENMLGDLVEMRIDDFIGALEAQSDKGASHFSQESGFWDCSLWERDGTKFREGGVARLGSYWNIDLKNGL